MTKTLKKGFTIVELLIVIVVIGILAAIVLVTYQGVQNKANTTSAEQNARELVGKATAFNAVATVFPDVTELKYAQVRGGAQVKEAKLGEKVAGLLGENKLPEGTSSEAKSRIAYAPCTKDSSRVGAVAVYWNYSDNKLALVKAGETDGTSCSEAIIGKITATTQEVPDGSNFATPENTAPTTAP